jgi:hypothetical protein
MYETLARVLCGLFVAGGGVYAVYALILKKKRRSFGRILFHGGFSLTLRFQGIAFLYYFPFNRFGFLATMNLIFFTYLAFILACYCKTPSRRTLVLGLITLIETAFTVWKLFTFTDVSFVARLPLNVCNILIIFLILRWVVRSPVLDNYVIFFGILAGLTSYTIGAFYDGDYDSLGLGFFHYRFVEATLLHNLLWLYAIFSYLTRVITVSRKRALQNMLWITPLFVIDSFLNQIWETDYFFTGVYGVTPPFLVDLYYLMPLRFQVEINHFSFDIHPVYSLFLLAALALILLILGILLGALQKRVSGVFSGREDRSRRTG